MKTGQKLPRRVYKYRDFSSRTLSLILADEVYFADPATFNDPMDTRPTLDADLGFERLQEVLRTLVEARLTAEMSAAAKKINYSGPKTTEHIYERSRRGASSLLAGIAYSATSSEHSGSFEILLAREIEKELLRRYDTGVLSLATRYNCPLMWSHYADQHRGLCIGYSVPDDMKTSLHKVRYGGSRLVKVSDVEKMLAGSSEAKTLVDANVLLKKSFDWRYEREWRLIGQRGQADSRLELEEIVFGMRCPDVVIHAVVKALEGRERDVKLFAIREVTGTFKLERCGLESEDFTTYPRRARGVLELFDDC